MRTGPSLKHRKQDFVRGAIWDAAVTLFIARGFDRTTVDEIARAAGVSKRSFFRYFSSKNDLMGQGIITYGAMITEAIRASARSATPFDVMRQTVEQVAVDAAAHPRVRKIAQVACTSVAAREAQLSRVADLEDCVADAYRARWRTAAGDDLTPRLLAELTLSVLDVTFRQWLKQDQQDILPTVDRVFASLLHLVDGKDDVQGKSGVLRPRRRVTRPRADARSTRKTAAPRRRMAPPIGNK
jgi:AcrR family transcriptional regulator